MAARSSEFEPLLWAIRTSSTLPVGSIEICNLTSPSSWACNASLGYSGCLRSITCASLLSSVDAAAADAAASCSTDGLEAVSVSDPEAADAEAASAMCGELGPGIAGGGSVDNPPVIGAGSGGCVGSGVGEEPDMAGACCAGRACIHNAPTTQPRPNASAKRISANQALPGRIAARSRSGRDRSGGFSGGRS